MFSSKTLISFRPKKERYGHLGWHGGESIISKSFFVFFSQQNYSFNWPLSWSTSFIRNNMINSFSRWCMFATVVVLHCQEQHQTNTSSLVVQRLKRVMKEKTFIIVQNMFLFQMNAVVFLPMVLLPVILFVCVWVVFLSLSSGLSVCVPLVFHHSV